MAATLLTAAGLFLSVPALASQKSAAVRRAENCPWTRRSAESVDPDVLARRVLSRMTLPDKLDLLVLQARDGYENQTTAIPSLCIPALTLQDGPNGLAYGDTGVTQLPSSLGLAATFDLPLAVSYGTVLGDEAKRQGVDVVQGPNLNIDRVPESGRAFEGYGEDPYLVSRMGVADIDGIQSEGVMADAKHFTAYTQETDRVALDESVPGRALEEIYLAPFKAAVEQGHVASVMCSYGSLDGVNDCADPTLFRILEGNWAFPGFVRSDLGAVTNAPLAFDHGLDMLKPATIPELREAIGAGALKMNAVDDAVERILTEMFSYHLVEQPIRGRLHSQVDTPAHNRVALETAEKSMVLLKNRAGTLPLRKLHSLAVIGADAAGSSLTAGSGGAYVVPPFVSTPLKALAASLGTHTALTYSDGGETTGPLAPIPYYLLERVTTRYLPHDSSGLVPASDPRSFNLSGAVGTGSIPRWLEPQLRNWSAVFVPEMSGQYTFSITSSGDTWFSVDGRTQYSSPGLHMRSTWSVSLPMRAGVRYDLALSSYPTSSGLVPALGMAYDGTAIAEAVEQARAAEAAIVFVRDGTSEGVDRPNLGLPGDENALISAVASVNRHTVVVLNTGGPVLMPWLSKVAAVLEAWYPGQDDGAATAAVLTGRVDPGGHLPVTFPAAGGQTPVSNPSSWPGVDGTVTFSEGLDVGYRYYDAHHMTPLFPFGFGLSYTSFSLAGLSTTPTADGYEVSVRVTNTGSRPGSTVVQAYLRFPAAAGEPPEQLVGFAAAEVKAGASTTVSFPVAGSSFESFLDGHFVALPGSYTISVGQSSASLPLHVDLSAPTGLPSLATAIGPGEVTAARSDAHAPGGTSGPVPAAKV